VIDREPDRPTSWIKVIHICKEGQRAMNREQGSYQLSDTYKAHLQYYRTGWCEEMMFSFF